VVVNITDSPVSSIASDTFPPSFNGTFLFDLAIQIYSLIRCRIPYDDERYNPHVCEQECGSSSQCIWPNGTFISSADFSCACIGNRVYANKGCVCANSFTGVDCDERCDNKTLQGLNCRISADLLICNATSMRFLPCDAPTSTTMMFEFYSSDFHSFPCSELTEASQLILQPTALRRFPSLSVFKLDMVDFGVIPVGFFSMSPNLTVIDLESARIFYLDPSTFQRNANLSELFGLLLLLILFILFSSLEFNSLTALPEVVLSQNPNLVALSFGFNLLMAVPGKLFIGQHRLKNVSFDSNLLTTLPDGFFNGTFALEFLNLYGNQLSSLPEHLFYHCSALLSLNLNKNRLSALPVGLFRNSPLLRIL
jgi:hypothetical protein